MDKRECLKTLNDIKQLQFDEMKKDVGFNPKRQNLNKFKGTQKSFSNKPKSMNRRTGR